MNYICHFILYNGMEIAMKKILSLVIILSMILSLVSSVFCYAGNSPYIKYENGSYYLYSDEAIKSGEIIAGDKKIILTNYTVPVNITPYLEGVTDSAILNIKTVAAKYTLNVSVLYAGGAGYSGDPYLIYTKEHFLNIQKNTKASYKLMADIEIITEPIEAFSGELDGNGHKITVAIDKQGNDNVGLFGTLSGEFKVENLKIYGSVKGNKNVGAIAGQLSGDPDGKSIIRNCENYADVASSKGSCGGIAGFANNTGDAAKTSFFNNVNYGSITSVDGAYTGGIIGLVTGQVSRCENHGKVSGKNYTGGIVGTLYGTISTSSNHGEVSSSGDSIYVAGIAGCSRSEAAEISNSYNTGNITGSSAAFLSGITNGYPTTAGGMNINCCYNIGDASYPLCYKNPNIPDDAVTVYRSYYLADSTKDIYGTNLTHEQMTNLNNFVGFISTTWEINKDGDYPYPQLAGTNTNDLLSYEFLPGVYEFSPLSQCKPINCIALEYKGRNLFFTSSQGSPAVFNAYDLDKKELLASFPMPKTRSPWCHIATEDMVYVVADRCLFSYNLETNEFKNYGYYNDTETATFGMCEGDDGYIYIGSYPNCKITRFDPKTKVFTDLGTLDPELSYARSLAYKNGYLYVVGFGNQKNRFIKVNPNNLKDKTSFEYQSVEGYFDANDIYWAYTVTEAENLILIYCYFSEGGPFLIVFDTDTDSFIDVGMRDRFKGQYATPVLNGKTYMIGGGGALYELDIATKKVKKLDFSADITDEFNGGGWVRLKDNPDFPGYTLVTVANGDGEGYPVLINFETKKRSAIVDAELDGGAISIHTLEKGPNGEMYTAGYMGSSANIYTPETDEYRKIPMGQAEGMKKMNGKMYFGVYDGGDFFEYDPTQPTSKTNPIKLGSVHGSRPFAMEPVGNRMYIGSIPGYGHLDGYLSYYDFDTNEIVDIDNIITNQSVMSLKYHNGYLYGSTTIFGGNSIDATEKEPKIFKFDVNTNKLIDSFTPDLKDVDEYNWIGAITTDKNGVMWGVSGNTLFSFDFEEKKVIKQYNFGNYTYDGRVWKPVKLRFDKDGILFVSINGLKAINVDTGEWMDLSHLTSVVPSVYEFDDYGNLYYAAGNSGDLYVLYKSEIEQTMEDISDARKFFNDKVGMKINTPYTISNGVPAMIDAENEEAVPFIYEDKTYMPLRATAEALGAEVLYDELNAAITIKSEATTLTLTTNSPRVVVNGKEMLLSNSPIVKDGRTYLPLREISSLFSLSLNWHDDGTIILSKENLNISDDFRNSISSYFTYYLEEDYVRSMQ